MWGWSRLVAASRIPGLGPEGPCLKAAVKDRDRDSWAQTAPRGCPRPQTGPPPLALAQPCPQWMLSDASALSNQEEPWLDEREETPKTDCLMMNQSNKNDQT